MLVVLGFCQAELDCLHASELVHFPGGHGSLGTGVTVSEGATTKESSQGEDVADTDPDADAEGVKACDVAEVGVGVRMPDGAFDTLAGSVAETTAGLPVALRAPKRVGVCALDGI